MIMNTDAAPLTISLLFIITTLFTLIWIIKKFKASKLVSAILILWLLVQALLSINGFYQNLNTIPPRFILLILPPLIFIIYVFTASQGQRFISTLTIKDLTLLHIIRIPVELVLWALYNAKQVPMLMTFEGCNFDIFSGISAPIIYYYIIKNENINKNILIAWNVICTLLLMIIVCIAILSAPSPLQLLSFEQPNIGVFKFPFNWLPSFIVPVVLFSHLVSLKKLFKPQLN